MMQGFTQRTGRGNRNCPVDHSSHQYRQSICFFLVGGKLAEKAGEMEEGTAAAGGRLPVDKRPGSPGGLVMVKQLYTHEELKGMRATAAVSGSQQQQQLLQGGASTSWYAWHVIRQDGQVNCLHGRALRSEQTQSSGRFRRYVL